MKAPVLFEQRAPLRVEELEVEAPREGEVSVRMDVSQERVIRGSIYGSARTREDFPRLVELYLAGKLRLDDLITRRYSIDEADQAFRDLAAGALARGLIVF